MLGRLVFVLQKSASSMKEKLESGVLCRAKQALAVGAGEKAQAEGQREGCKQEDFWLRGRKLGKNGDFAGGIERNWAD